MLKVIESFQSENSSVLRGLEPTPKFFLNFTPNKKYRQSKPEPGSFVYQCFSHKINPNVSFRKAWEWSPGQQQCLANVK